MAQMKAFRAIQKQALEFIALDSLPPAGRDAARHETLKADPLVQYLILDSQANVLCPATKLWNTGHGANLMREAVSLMGGYGITEDCPGFLGHKWMDAQLEATYEGPEAVQRRQLSLTMTSEVFLACFRTWIGEMRGLPPSVPGPAPARWRPPWTSGSGRSAICTNPPTLAAQNSIPATGRA